MATTSTSPRRTNRSELQHLARRLNAWRTTRTARQRIPDELWRAATDVARVHGLSPVAAALKLNYCDLQRRLRAGRSRRAGRSGVPTFVEVPRVAAPLGSGERGTLEVVHPSGSRLILRLPQAGARDFVPLVERFLRPRA